MIIPNPFRFIKAMCRVVWAWIQRKRVLVPVEIEQQRLNICTQGCPFFDPEARQCTECTCFVDLKVPLATERCPRGRWERHVYKNRHFGT